MSDNLVGMQDASRLVAEYALHSTLNRRQSSCAPDQNDLVNFRLRHPGFIENILDRRLKPINERLGDLLELVSR